MTSVRIAYKTGSTVPLDKLRGLQGDLKDLPDENYQKLKTEIVETGFAFPPHVWRNPKDKIHHLVDGHQRIATLKRMQAEGYKIDDIPVVAVEAKDMKEARRRVLQATSQYGRMTEDSLAKFLNSAKLDIDFVRDRFDLPHIDMDQFARNFLEHDGKIVSVSEHQRTIGKTDPDEIPDNVKSACKLGDLWQLGEHRLLCGDSTNRAQVSRLMGAVKAEMMFTDPPYGVGYEGGHLNKRKREKIINDDSSDIYSRVAPVISEFVDGPCYTWFAFTQCRPTVEAIEAIGEMHALIIWNKTNATYAAMNAQYKQRHEPCIYWKPKGSTLRWTGPTNECTVWDIKRDGRNDMHPTQKPVELAERAINNHSAESVLDLFGGSGSTMIACETLKRQCYMMELDPHYCDVIVNRWQNFTGQQAKKIK